MDPICKECGERLIGRIDKKYCSDYCRNTYNNRRYREASSLVRSVNNRLKKNYRILKDFPLNQGKTVIRHRELSERGFDFRVITQLHISQKGRAYFVVYDMGYHPVQPNRYELVKMEL